MHVKVSVKLNVCCVMHLCRRWSFLMHARYLTKPLSCMKLSCCELHLGLRLNVNKWLYEDEHKNDKQKYTSACSDFQTELNLICLNAE